MRRRTVKLVQNPRTRKQLGYGEWVPAKAVRVNPGGTVDVYRGRRNIFVGEKEADSDIFHPFRWSADYDPLRLSKKSPEYKRAKRAATAKKRKRRTKAKAKSTRTRRRR